MKRHDDVSLLWGVVMEAEAYSQAATACSVIANFVNIA